MNEIEIKSPITFEVHIYRIDFITAKTNRLKGKEKFREKEKKQKMAQNISNGN